MNKPTCKTYAISIALTEAIGALSGWLTRRGTRLYNATVTQPPLSPPAIVFPIVWGLLFALMGIGAARIYKAPPTQARRTALLLFALQLAFNFGWSIIFFNFMAYGAALVWLLVLWALIIAMIISFYRVDKRAARLQIPYLLWVTFAAYLNYGVWQLN